MRIEVHDYAEEADPLVIRAMTYFHHLMAHVDAGQSVAVARRRWRDSRRLPPRR